MNRKIVDHEGKPLDEATLARIFQPMSPELFDDPVCGAELRRLAVEHPDVIAAVADVDRTLIWPNVAPIPEESSGSAEAVFARGARQIDRLCDAMDQVEALTGFRRVA